MDEEEEEELGGEKGRGRDSRRKEKSRGKVCSKGIEFGRMEEGREIPV